MFNQYYLRYYKKLQTLEAIKDLDYTMPAYEIAKLKRVINNDIGGIIDDIMSQISEIEDRLKSVG